MVGKAVAKVLKTILLCLVLVLVAFPGAQTQAASRKSALKAYKKFLEKKTIQVKLSSQSLKIKPEYFAVVKVNNDSIPELLVRSSLTSYLFTYRNGKVKQISKNAIGTNVVRPSAYYPTKSIFYLTGIGGVGATSADYMKVNIKNGKISYIASCFHGMNFTDYRISGKTVGKGDFKRYMAGQTKGISMKNTKYAKNNKTNRNNKLR